MSKESFKSFARLHPELAESVLKNNVTWQKLYELYDIYGENSNIWDKYFTKTLGDSKISDIVDTIKKVDLNTVQNNIESMQKAIELLQEIGIGKAKETIGSSYQSRPMYKYFED